MELARQEVAARKTKRARVALGLEKEAAPVMARTVGALAKEYEAAGYPDRRGERRDGARLKQEKSRVAQLLRWWERIQIGEITHALCREYGTWKMKQTKEGTSGRRAADMELSTLAGILRWAGVSPNPLDGRPVLWSPGKARHARDCAPASGDELHLLAKQLLAGPRSEVLGWQLLFEALTGCRTSEVLRMRLDAAARKAGHLEPGKWLWLERSKGGVNPYVVLDGRPELCDLILAHRAWHEDRYPASPWYFPSPEDPAKPVDPCSLAHALRRIGPDLGISHPLTSHGLRAFYCLVRRSQGALDAMIAAEIGDKTTSLIHQVYGDLPPNWQGGAAISFLPEKGAAAWVIWL
ncbi:MAG TPA: hypothetical protein VEH27_02450 [Methylomirabilota bacterium]|nr:hypothetical protein [Methylomirabilota bacterium]